MSERTIYVKNWGHGKVGDTVVAEPALAAYGEQENCKIHFDVAFEKNHEELFAGHPWIVPVPYLIPKDKPDFQMNTSDAFHFSHAKGVSFGAGFFSQLGLSHEGRRVHYKNYDLDNTLVNRDASRYANSVIIVGNGYSCTSRDSTTGQPKPNASGNVQPPVSWWYPILDAIPKDKEVFCLASKSNWDWVRFPEIQTIETESFSYILRILKVCSLLISVETGILHLASAAKSPTLFLSCATPVVFSRPDTECRVCRAWKAEEFRHTEVINAMNELLRIK